MQPQKISSNMDYKFESRDENTVSVYTEDTNGTKNEVVRLHVMSEGEYDHFKEVTSSVQSSAMSKVG